MNDQYRVNIEYVGPPLVNILTKSQQQLPPPIFVLEPPTPSSLINTSPTTVSVTTTTNSIFITTTSAAATKPAAMVTSSPSPVPGPVFADLTDEPEVDLLQVRVKEECMEPEWSSEEMQQFIAGLKAITPTQLKNKGPIVLTDVTVNNQTIMFKEYTRH